MNNISKILNFKKTGSEISDTDSNASKQSNITGMSRQMSRIGKRASMMKNSTSFRLPN